LRREVNIATEKNGSIFAFVTKFVKGGEK